MRTFQLSEVCHIAMGQAPKGSSYNADGNGYPLLAGAGDFGEEVPEPSKFTTEPSKISKPGDILLCIRATIGDLNWSDKEYCLGRGVAGLRPKNKELDRNYLWRWLSFARPELERRGRGSTFKQVARKDIADLEIVLPSDLNEQRKIAAILDKADAILRKRKEALSLTNSLLRSCFFRIIESKGGSYQPLGNHLVFVTSGSRGWAQYYSSTGSRFIRSFDVQMNFISSHDAVFVNAPRTAEADRARVRPGDVLLTITGSRIGRVACVGELREDAYISQHVAIIRPTDSLLPEFLSFYLSLPSGGQRQIEKMQYGQTKPGLNLNQIREFEVPIPTIDQQRAFVHLAGKVNRLIFKELRRFDDAQNLMNVLAQRAFQGVLKLPLERNMRG